MGIYPFTYYEEVYANFSPENTEQANIIANKPPEQGYIGEWFFPIINSNNESEMILIWVGVFIAIMYVMGICIPKPGTLMCNKYTKQL